VAIPYHQLPPAIKLTSNFLKFDSFSPVLADINSLYLFCSILAEHQQQVEVGLETAAVMLFVAGGM